MHFTSNHFLLIRRRNGDFAAAARYLGIGIEQRCKELGYASAEKFVAALERQQEFGRLKFSNFRFFL